MKCNGRIGLQLLGVALALSFGATSCSKKDEDEKKDDAPSGWATETYRGNDKCVDVAASKEGADDPDLSKFSGPSTLGEDAEAVAGESCETTKCVGRCVDTNGRYYTYTVYFYEPTFSTATANAACDDPEKAPTGGSVGTFAETCE